MNIVIINGNPDPGNIQFDSYLLGYQLKLHKTGHYVKTFLLRDMIKGFAKEGTETEIHLHTGYAANVLNYIIHAVDETDLLVVASPLRQKALPALVRSVQEYINRHFQARLSDRTHKWADEVSGRRIPMIGVIIQPEAGTSPQDLLLIRLTQERLAANIETVMSFMITTNMSVADAVCATFRSFDYRRYIEVTCNDLLEGSISRFTGAGENKSAFQQ